MRDKRMTVLLSSDEEAGLKAEARKLGVSSGEYIRLAVDNFAGATAEEEAELAALVEQVNKAVPKMQASIDGMIATLQRSNAETDAFLRKMGVRK